MIQIKRGKSSSWAKSTTILADGQPGYDKDKHQLKIGDGKTSWSELPSASGLGADSILCSEEQAKKLHTSGVSDTTIITYGTNKPDASTVGQLYLQYSESAFETDYVVSSGVDNGWLYQKWNSGIAMCSKTFDVATSVQTELEGSNLYQNTIKIDTLPYPFTFKAAPCETASIQSPSGLVWLASAKCLNTASHSSAYSILSADRLTNSTTYRISVKVEGFWK